MLEYAISRLDVTGCHLTEYSIKILSERGYSFIISTEREVARDINEKLDCVAEDFEAETKQEETSDTSDIAKDYELPKRRVIIIDVRLTRKMTLAPASIKVKIVALPEEIVYVLVVVYHHHLNFKKCGLQKMSVMDLV